MNINVIGRTDQSWFAKIGASGKKRVESLEVGVVRVVIAAGNVRFESEPGFERSIFKCEPNIRRCCPSLNVATAEAAELIDEFKVSPNRFFVPKSACRRSAGVREPCLGRSARSADPALDSIGPCCRPA